MSLLAVLAFWPGRSTLAAETCTRPQPPSVPSGSTAERDAMISIQTDVDAYLGRMQEYVDCLARESEDASAEADRVVDQWNVALQNFKARP